MVVEKAGGVGKGKTIIRICCIKNLFSIKRGVSESISKILFYKTYVFITYKIYEVKNTYILHKKS